MRAARATLLVGVLGFALAGPAAAQAPSTQPPAAPTLVDVQTGATPSDRNLEIIAPEPGAQDVTRPREADFYPEDVRVRHGPGFVEPLTVRPKIGPVKKVGVSGWTAPPGRGDGIVQREINGWFGFGISVIWE
jgi:hypothetical protein